MISSKRFFLFAAIALPLSVAHAAHVADIEASHRHGQTFITWKEPNPVTSNAKITALKLAQEISKLKSGARETTYRVYRSKEPIMSLDDLKPVGEIGVLSAWRDPSDYASPVRIDRLGVPLRFIISDGGKPLAPNQGLYVHNPVNAGDSYYAVTMVENGNEDRTLVNGMNVLVEPVVESVGQGEPVLQLSERKSSFNGIKNPMVNVYTRWEAPPNCAVEGFPMDYLVAVPENCPEPMPCGLHLHSEHTSLIGGYGFWQYYEGGSVLVSTNMVPYDWWTGYNENYWRFARRATDKDEREKSYVNGVVRPYTQNRLVSFLDWVGKNYAIDQTRTFVTGSGMGGSGGIALAIRNPDVFSFCNSWGGVHSPAMSEHFKPSYNSAYGEADWNIKTDDGSLAWDYFDDSDYLETHQEKSIPLVIFSGGMNDRNAGWEQALRLAITMQATRQPHIFRWDLDGELCRSRLPVSLSDGPPMKMNIRDNQSLPAFTNCSLDGDPGTGKLLDEPTPEPEARPGARRLKQRLYDGDPQGQFNQFLFWDTENIIDDDDKWEITVGLTPQAPKANCRVDITPRRVVNFKTPPGTRVEWINLSGGRQIQSGIAVADDYGLITLPQLSVGKGGNMIAVKRSIE